MLGRNKKVAREEYLTSLGDKEAVRFEAQEKNICFSDVVNDITGIIHLKMSVPGYAEIEVFSRDQFISFDRKVITSDDFKDGICEFSFTVIAQALHNGKNFARITFRTPVCAAQTDIVVDNSVRVGYAQTNSRRKLALLERTYIDFRLGNLFQTEWQEKSLEILGEVNGGNVYDMFLMLYKANVLISCGRMSEADSLMEFVWEQMQKLKERNWDLICYFYYISSIYEMDREVTGDLSERVHTIYELHPDWKILWILFYMDEKLSRSPKEVLKMIEGEFLIRGCNSPVMYFEAAEALRKAPDLITEPSKFVICTLDFAAKEDFLNINTSGKFAEVIWQAEDRTLKYLNIDACIRILKESYDRFQGTTILKSLCRLLILDERKEPEYHAYYEKAINEFLDIHGLYEYFIYSAGDDRYISIPDIVLEFFSGREYELGERRNYYFACLVKHKDEYGKYYENSKGNMLRSVNEALDRGRMNQHLAVLYKEVMDEYMLSKDKFARMLEMLCLREVVTENKLISSVLVFHREFNEYQEAELKEGSALVRIFTNDAIVLFKDTTGNLYYNIDHVMRKFMPRRGYSELCIRNSNITRYMLVGDNLDILRSAREPAQILNYLYDNMGKGDLRGRYEQEILKDLIEFFAKRKEEGTADLLIRFLKFNLEDSTRARLVEILIENMKYKEAYEEIEKNGFREVSDDHIAALAHVLAEVTDYEKDDVMNELCCRAFLSTDFDPVIFKYMCRNYDDRLDVLILMYVAARANKTDDITIAERVIRKTIETGEYPPEAESIFADYYANGDDGTLKKDFLAAVALRHLYHRDKGAGYIFKYIESAAAAGEKFPDNVMVAYLLYMTDAAEPSRKSLKVSEEMLNGLVRRGIMLEEFKQYREYFVIPSVLSNTFIAEKIVEREEEDQGTNITRGTMFGSAPRIVFELRTRDGTFSSEEAMKEVAPGIFTRNFTLFFSESVEYRIDEGHKCVVTYNDLKVSDDGSRYSRLNEMIRKLHGKDAGDVPGIALDYQKTSMLINRIFK